MMTTEAPLGRQKWSDILEDENEDDLNQEITTSTEYAEDGSILKTVVEYKTNDKGQKVKVIKKIRVFKTNVKVNMKVEERKKWRKFGECRDLPAGPEPGITTVGDEIFIEHTGESDQKKDVAPGPAISVTCRKCKGDHWTVKCPYKDKIDIPMSVEKDLSAQLSAASLGGGESGKYRPPGARSREGPPSSGGGGGPTDSSGRPRRDEYATIRVSNLSEDTKESDINELFRGFGPISRIYLAKDKSTGLSKGFAFVSFIQKKDAAKAIEKLSGYGYDHLILRVDWAKPSGTE